MTKIIPIAFTLVITLAFLIATWENRQLRTELSKQDRELADYIYMYDNLKIKCERGYASISH